MTSRLTEEILASEPMYMLLGLELGCVLQWCFSKNSEYTCIYVHVCGYQDGNDI
jgi:hypothetical protein